MTRSALRLAPVPCALVLALAVVAPSAQAAESYDNCTGFIDSLPATISTQGVWCLRKNLTTSMTAGAAITIAANNITIDCNEFKIGGLAAGNGSEAYAIYAEDRMNATIRNCGIRGFARGIWLYGGGGSHNIEHNRLDQNYYAGILINGSDGNRVFDNRVFDTGGSPSGGVAIGIQVDGDAIDNTVNTVFGLQANMIAYGIVVHGIGSEARGNRVRNLLATGTGTARGISAMAANITVTGNRVSNGTLAAGEGIHGAGATTFCNYNTVANYPNPYWSCDYSANNLPVLP